MQITVPALLTRALAEIRVARGGDVLDGDTADLALTLFNELLDGLNADGRAIYARGFATFTLTPNHQPHTIGLSTNTPVPDFTVTVGRPVAIRGANLVLANNVRSPLALRDDEWWLDLRVPTVPSAIPTDLNYRPDWPNGSIYLWQVPTTAYSLELVTDTQLAQVASGDTLDLPQGYVQALALTLAELCAPAFGQTVSGSTVIKAREARARVWGDDDEIPTLDTRDAGMPNSGGGGFNFRTGFVE
jgi:hypothetical protein